MNSQGINIPDYPVLILVFGMEDCPACQAYLPKFRRVAARHPTIPAFAVDAERQPDPADKAKVSVTPTTMLLSYGQQLVRREGEGDVADIEHMFRYAESYLDRQGMSGPAWRRG